jgi:hypothetical protein
MAWVRAQCRTRWAVFGAQVNNGALSWNASPVMVDPPEASLPGDLVRPRAGRAADIGT